VSEAERLPPPSPPPREAVGSGAVPEAHTLPLRLIMGDTVGAPLPLALAHTLRALEGDAEGLPPPPPPGVGVAQPEDDPLRDAAVALPLTEGAPEGGALKEAAFEGEGVPVALPLRQPLPDADAVPEADTDPDGESVLKGEGDALPEKVPTGDSDAEPVGEPLHVGDDVPQPLPLPATEREGDGDADAHCEALRERVGDPLALTQPLPLPLAGGVPVPRALRLRAPVVDPQPLCEPEREPDGLALGLTVALRERVGEPLRLGLALPLRLPLGVPLALALRLPLGVGEGDAHSDALRAGELEVEALGVLLRQKEGVPVEPALVLALRERLGEGDALALPVSVRVGVARPLAEGVGVEGFDITVCEGVEEGGGERLGMAEALAAALWDCVKMPERDPAVLCVPHEERVATSLAVSEGAAVAVPIGVEVGGRE
jgi:hypothetical protein